MVPKYIGRPKIGEMDTCEVGRICNIVFSMMAIYDYVSLRVCSVITKAKIGLERWGFRLILFVRQRRLIDSEVAGSII